MIGRREFITVLGGAANRHKREPRAPVIVARNVRIDYRWGAGDVDRYRAIATELVALAPDAIVALGYAAVSALQKATRSVPIVFTNVIDPVGGGCEPGAARRQHHRIFQP